MSSIPPEVAKGRIFTFDKTDPRHNLLTIYQYSPTENTHSAVGRIDVDEKDWITPNLKEFNGVGNTANKLVYKGTLTHRETKGKTGTKQLMSFADLPKTAQEGLIKFLRKKDFRYTIPGSKTEEPQAEAPQAEAPQAEAPQAEANARKEALEAAAKPSTDPRIIELLKEFQDNKRIVKAGDITNASMEDRLILTRQAILTRRKQLKEPKNKDLYEVLKTNEIMTWKLPPMPKRK